MQVTHLTKSDFLTGATSPVNKVTPEFVGQIYIENSKYMYIATNLTPKSWLSLQPRIESLDSVDNVGELILSLINSVDELKPLAQQIKDINSGIDNLEDIIENQPSVRDIHNILKEAFNLKDYYTRKPIDNKFLGYDALIDDLQRRLDAIELKATVGCMGITAPTELNLTSNDPVALGVKLSPYNTTDLLEFTSTNANIVTVDRGVIQPQGVNGSAIIKMTCGSRKAECVVNITLDEEIEVVDGLISTSEELYVVNDYLVAPIISNISSSIDIKYLMWELVFEDKTISLGTFQANEKLLNKVLFDCSYLNSQKEFVGVKIYAKKYDPTTGTFKVVGTSNDITLKFS